MATPSRISLSDVGLLSTARSRSMIRTFTFPGGTWVPHEWLAEIVFAAVYDGLGWGGVIATTGLAIAAAFALLARALQRSLGPRRAAIGALLAFALTENRKST